MLPLKKSTPLLINPREVHGSKRVSAFSIVSVVLVAVAALSMMIFAASLAKGGSSYASVLATMSARTSTFIGSTSRHTPSASASMVRKAHPNSNPHPMGPPSSSEPPAGTLTLGKRTEAQGILSAGIQREAYGMYPSATEDVSKTSPLPRFMAWLGAVASSVALGTWFLHKFGSKRRVAMATMEGSDPEKKYSPAQNAKSVPKAATNPATVSQKVSQPANVTVPISQDTSVPKVREDWNKIDAPPYVEVSMDMNMKERDPIDTKVEVDAPPSKEVAINIKTEEPKPVEVEVDAPPSKEVAINTKTEEPKPVEVSVDAPRNEVAIDMKTEEPEPVKVPPKETQKEPTPKRTQPTKSYLRNETGKTPDGLDFFASKIDDFIADMGPPSFWRPLPSTEHTKLPIMVYLPGVDGTGVACAKQFPALVEKFDLICMTIPANDRTKFNDLVELVIAELKTLASVSEDRDTPLYVMGESFGGALSLAVACKEPQLIQRIVAVNPGTSFGKSIWPTAGGLVTQAPSEVYPFMGALLAPVLGNPVALALAMVENKPNPIDKLMGLASSATGLLDSALLLPKLLPPETLDHKLTLLTEAGTCVTDESLSKIKSRVLCVAGEFDLLLPSRDEAARLSKAIPLGTKKILPNSHALLEEVGVNIAELLEGEGFYQPKRVRSGPGKLATDLPTSEEVINSCERLGINTLERLVSPVFFSTTVDGKVEQGLDAFDWESRPILLIGNHQTLSPDLGLLIKRILLDKKTMLRGLAHPAVFQNGGPGGDRQQSQQSFGGQRTDTPTNKNIFKEFGAVPVNGKSLYRLMEGDEIALLYPGGVREAYKRKGEEYQLIWPSKPEFVRTAAKFGATIIPLAAIGADDGVDMVLDSPEVLNLPFVGESLAQRQNKAPKVRSGSEGMGDELFVPPVVVPRLDKLNRYYFLFGKPIQTSPDLSREECDELYGQVKDALAGDIDYLLEKRKEDPYSGPNRVAYEAIMRTEAPSFKP